MGNMEAWDVVLLVAGGYLAITALVRLMLRRRDHLVAQFRDEVHREKRRRQMKAAMAERQKAA